MLSRPPGQGIPLVNLENPQPQHHFRRVDRSIRPCMKICNHKRTNLTEESLRLIRLKYDIADEVEMMLPEEHEHPGWSVPGWHFLYLDPLVIGVRFPLKGIAKIVLDHYRIAPSQLCPGGWKILLCLDMLGLLQGLQPLTVEDFLQSYFFRDHDRGTVFMCDRS